MGKVATTVEEQIALLESRGMVFDCDISKVKEILLDIGYYRLGFYWNPFEIDNQHNFAPNTLFSNVVKLYYLDVDLRNLLLKSLYRVEINFRTKIVYYVSNRYNQSATWFINPKVMSISFVSNISKHYNNEFIRSNKTIKKHHEVNINDKYAPAWKTLEFFTFGAVFKVYNSLLDDELKLLIANQYGVLNLKKFLNLLKTLVYLRNVCSHGGVLFDLKTPIGIASIKSPFFEDNDRFSLNAVINVLRFFLDGISENRRKELDQCLEEILTAHKENDIINDIILNQIRYKK